MSGVPMPNEVHSDYANMPELRGAVNSTMNHLVIAMSQEAEAEAMPAIFAPSREKRILTIQRAAGPAPFVGDPRRQDAFYVWPVATDDAGAYVAGEAVLQIVDAPEKIMRAGP